MWPCGRLDRSSETEMNDSSLLPSPHDRKDQVVEEEGRDKIAIDRQADVFSRVVGEVSSHSRERTHAVDKDIQPSEVAFGGLDKSSAIVFESNICPYALGPYAADTRLGYACLGRTCIAMIGDYHVAIRFCEFADDSSAKSLGSSYNCNAAIENLFFGCCFGRHCQSLRTVFAFRRRRG